MSTFDDRGGSKWDRAARYLKIAQVLHAHGEAGISAAALARQVGVSKRTVYRDLEAMDLDAGLAIWNDGGRFGLEAGAFLPPLALTLPEALAFFLAARLLTKATDELDPEIIGAFVKLAQVLPPVLAEQLHETADAFADTPRDEAFTRVLRSLTEALAGRRVVEIEYTAGVYDASKGMRRLRLQPYAIEPSAQTRALYVIGFDEERQDRRTFKVERIRSASLTPDTFPSRSPSVAAEMRSPGTSSATTPRWRSSSASRHPWHSAWRRRAGIPARSRSSSTMAPCSGGRASPASWRSAPGSSAGARTPRSSSRPTCASGSPRGTQRPPSVTAAEGRRGAGYSALTAARRFSRPAFASAKSMPVLGFV